jgi:hypothetical protein
VQCNAISQTHRLTLMRMTRAVEAYRKRPPASVKYVNSLWFVPWGTLVTQRTYEQQSHGQCHVQWVKPRRQEK